MRPRGARIGKGSFRIEDIRFTGKSCLANRFGVLPRFSWDSGLFASPWLLDGAARPANPVGGYSNSAPVQPSCHGHGLALVDQAKSAANPITLVAGRGRLYHMGAPL